MIEVVAGVIFDEQGRILACQRPEGKHLAGKWEFPGGKIEHGESPEVALIRELLEELGIEVEVTAPLTPVLWDYGQKPIRLLPYRCRIITGRFQPLEHSAIEWLSLADWRRLDWADADVPILEELLNLR